MNDRKQILDHGYIELVEAWGSDERIIEAARMSTDKGFKGWGRKPAFVVCVKNGGNTWYLKCSADPRGVTTDHDIIASKTTGMTTTLSLDLASTWTTRGRAEHAAEVYTARYQGQLAEVWLDNGVVGDEKLLRFLYENKHTTPFEMAGAIIEVQAPIFVFREWHRHRTQSYNELSARYTPMPDVNYVPSVERLMMGGGHLTKQAGTIAGADALTEDVAVTYCGQLEEFYAEAEQFYQESLKRGVPKELARLCVPVGRYSRMRASACLLNWLRFASLRSDANPGAQWEIRQYGNALVEILSEKFPRTMALFGEKKP